MLGRWYCPPKTIGRADTELRVLCHRLILVDKRQNNTAGARREELTTGSVREKGIKD